MSARWMVSRVFTREFASGANLGHGHEGAAETAAMWKKIFFIVACPAIALGMLNVYLHETQDEHVRPPFVPYEHMRIRTKRFPWGDGQKSLFHNPHVNALPTGYEDEH